MSETTASLHEFRNRPVSGVTPLLWVTVTTNGADRSGATSCRLCMDGYHGERRAELLRDDFGASAGRLLEEIEPISEEKDKVLCVVRTKSGKVIASYAVTCSDKHFTVAQIKRPATSR